MSTSIEEYVRIDKRIDAAEKRAANGMADSLRERWEFGRRMLAQRKGKRLPNNSLADLAQRHRQESV